MGKILILPDVHGRQFWKDACLNHKDEFEKIIFLGDYVSPYPYEEISNKKAIDVFEEVLKFKKENPDKVVLLMGNHDFSYINSSICECRTDFTNWNKLNGLFTDNMRMFDLAWETKVGDKRFFFSHSGVRKGWFEKWIKDKLFKWDGDELPPADYFNNLLHAAYDDGRNFDARSTHDFEYAIGVYSLFRGWDGWDDGSMVWADIREYARGMDEGKLKSDYNDVVFVCGHTQLENQPIITEWVMDLDCRKPFVLDTETGIVEEYK